MDTKEMAELVGTSPKNLRKFLRSQVKEAGGTIGEDTPGKGKRYTFEKKEVKTIKSQFAAWSEANAKARAERLAKLAAEEESTEEETDESELTEVD